MARESDDSNSERLSSALVPLIVEIVVGDMLPAKRLIKYGVAFGYTLIQVQRSALSSHVGVLIPTVDL
jgi:hypothetical protein